MAKKLTTLLGCKDILKLEQFKERIREENEDSFSDVEEPLFGGIVNFRDHKGKYVTGYMLVSPNISKYHTYAIDFYTLEGKGPKGEHPLESMKFKDITIGETYTAFIDWQSFESYLHILNLICSTEVNTLFVPTIKLHDSNKKKYSLSVQLNGVDIKPATNRVVTNANKSVYCIEYDSGKSLIAKVISNSIKDNWIVTADRFRFNDVELLKLTPNQRRKIVGKEISMIFQNPLSCLDPSRKIGKQLIQSIPNWTFKGRWWQWFGWKKRRAIELLHRVGIKDHQDIMASYPNELTEGEGQKVMIAVAVANQPRLLIADEPTNSLESITALQIFRLLSSMNQNQGTTILLASNDLKSISEWCDSISVLYCGQNTESGPTDQILEMPHHPYTQALLYSVPDFSRPLGFKSKLGTLEGTVPILEQMPIGCRLGPRCPFAQRECIQKPSRYRIKQHEFSCHHPINLRERQFKDKIATSPLTLNTESKGNE